MADILRRIDYFENHEQRRLKRLDDYYKIQNKITKTVKEPGKPNNKLVHNYAKSIVNNTVGYFMGSPVTYEYNKEAPDSLIEVVEEIKKINDEDTHNVTIATNISKFGVAYELLWIDEEKNIRYSSLDVLTSIPYFTESIDKKLKEFIYFYDVFDYDTELTTRYVDYYDDKEKVSYEIVEGTGLRFLEKTPHYFGEVPVIIYKNNEEEIGDYEDVISLIDGYDVMQSDSINDFQQFADAYLFVSGMAFDEELIKKMKDNRVLVGEGNAQWLVKQTNDTHIENVKTRLDTDIFKFSNTVNMSDESFTNNLSGKAIKYKLINMENRIKITENYFKKALSGRYKLVCNYLKISKSLNADYKLIRFTFTRNVPSDLTDIATVIQMLKDTVSDQTLLKLLPFIDNVEEEFKKLQQERKENSEYSPFVPAEDEEEDDINEQ